MQRSECDILDAIQTTFHVLPELLDCQCHLQEPSDRFRRFQSDIRENIKFRQVLRVFITSRTIASNVGRDCSIHVVAGVLPMARAKPRTQSVCVSWQGLRLKPHGVFPMARATPRIQSVCFPWQGAKPRTQSGTFHDKSCSMEGRSFGNLIVVSKKGTSN